MESISQDSSWGIKHMDQAPSEKPCRETVCLKQTSSLALTVRIDKGRGSQKILLYTVVKLLKHL